MNDDAKTVKGDDCWNFSNFIDGANNIVKRCISDQVALSSYTEETTKTKLWLTYFAA